MSQTFTHPPDISTLFYTLCHLLDLAHITEIHPPTRYIHLVLHTLQPTTLNPTHRHSPTHQIYPPCSTHSATYRTYPRYRHSPTTRHIQLVLHTLPPTKPSPSHRHSPTHQIYPTCFHTLPTTRPSHSHKHSPIHPPDISNFFSTLCRPVVLTTVTDIHPPTRYIHLVLQTLPPTRPSPSHRHSPTHQIYPPCFTHSATY